MSSKMLKKWEVLKDELEYFSWVGNEIDYWVDLIYQHYEHPGNSDGEYPFIYNPVQSPVDLPNIAPKYYRYLIREYLKKDCRFKYFIEQPGDVEVFYLAYSPKALDIYGLPVEVSDKILIDNSNADYAPELFRLVEWLMVKISERLLQSNNSQPFFVRHVQQLFENDSFQSNLNIKSYNTEKLFNDVTKLIIVDGRFQLEEGFVSDTLQSSEDVFWLENVKNPVASPPGFMSIYSVNNDLLASIVNTTVTTKSTTKVTATKPSNVAPPPGFGSNKSISVSTPVGKSKKSVRSNSISSIGSIHRSHSNNDSDSDNHSIVSSYTYKSTYGAESPEKNNDNHSATVSDSSSRENNNNSTSVNIHRSTATNTSEKHVSSEPIQQNEPNASYLQEFPSLQQLGDKKSLKTNKVTRKDKKLSVGGIHHRNSGQIEDTTPTNNSITTTVVQAVSEHVPVPGVADNSVHSSSDLSQPNDIIIVSASIETEISKTFNQEAVPELVPFVFDPELDTRLKAHNRNLSDSLLNQSLEEDCNFDTDHFDTNNDTNNETFGALEALEGGDMGLLADNNMGDDDDFDLNNLISYDNDEEIDEINECDVGDYNSLDGKLSFDNNSNSCDNSITTTAAAYETTDKINNSISSDFTSDNNISTTGVHNTNNINNDINSTVDNNSNINNINSNNISNNTRGRTDSTENIISLSKKVSTLNVNSKPFEYNPKSSYYNSNNNSHNNSSTTSPVPMQYNSNSNNLNSTLMSLLPPTYDATNNVFVLSDADKYPHIVQQLSFKIEKELIRKFSENSIIKAYKADTILSFITALLTTIMKNNFEISKYSRDLLVGDVFDYLKNGTDKIFYDEFNALFSLDSKVQAAINQTRNALRSASPTVPVISVANSTTAPINNSNNNTNNNSSNINNSNTSLSDGIATTNGNDKSTNSSKNENSNSTCGVVLKDNYGNPIKIGTRYSPVPPLSTTLTPSIAIGTQIAAQVTAQIAPSSAEHNTVALEKLKQNLNANNVKYNKQSLHKMQQNTNQKYSHNSNIGTNQNYQQQQQQQLHKDSSLMQPIASHKSTTPTNVHAHMNHALQNNAKILQQPLYKRNNNSNSGNNNINNSGNGNHNRPTNLASTGFDSAAYFKNVTDTIQNNISNSSISSVSGNSIFPPESSTFNQLGGQNPGNSISNSNFSGNNNAYNINPVNNNNNLFVSPQLQPSAQPLSAVSPSTSYGLSPPFSSPLTALQYNAQQLGSPLGAQPGFNDNVPIWPTAQQLPQQLPNPLTYNSNALSQPMQPMHPTQQPHQIYNNQSTAVPAVAYQNQLSPQRPFNTLNNNVNNSIYNSNNNSSSFVSPQLSSIQPSLPSPLPLPTYGLPAAQSAHQNKPSGYSNMINDGLAELYMKNNITNKNVNNNYNFNNNSNNSNYHGGGNNNSNNHNSTNNFNNKNNNNSNTNQNFYNQYNEQNKKFPPSALAIHHNPAEITLPDYKTILKQLSAHYSAMAVAQLLSNNNTAPFKINTVFREIVANNIDFEHIPVKKDNIVRAVVNLMKLDKQLMFAEDIDGFWLNPNK